MPKEKVNYQEVYDLYQLCSETKNLKEFCSEYGINYDKFMNWQRHQLWDEMWRGGKKTFTSYVSRSCHVRVTSSLCLSCDTACVTLCHRVIVT